MGRDAKKQGEQGQIVSAIYAILMFCSSSEFLSSILLRVPTKPPMISKTRAFPRQANDSRVETALGSSSIPRRCLGFSCAIFLG